MRCPSWKNFFCLNWQTFNLHYLIWVTPNSSNHDIFLQLGFYVSNWQKVQLNTHLFSDTQKYLYTENGLIKKTELKGRGF